VCVAKLEIRFKIKSFLSGKFMDEKTLLSEKKCSSTTQNPEIVFYCSTIIYPSLRLAGATRNPYIVFRCSTYKTLSQSASGRRDTESYPLIVTRFLAGRIGVVTKTTSALINVTGDLTSIKLLIRGISITVNNH
jgi:hypothetical protein